MINALVINLLDTIQK